MAVLYCIKYQTSVPEEDIYSTEERIVGRWIDGKPVYKRTMAAHTEASTSSVKWKNLGIPIENVDKIIDISATISSSDGFLVPLPYAIDTSIVSVGYSFGNNGDGSVCTLCVNTPTLENRAFETTFLYTKTTDLAPNGNYTAIPQSTEVETLSYDFYQDYDEEVA